MFQATRRRLTIWYAAVTGVLLLLFVTGVYLYVRHTLIERVDDTLEHVIEVLTRSLVIEPVSASEGKYRLDIESSFPNPAQSIEDDHIDIEWFDPEGRMIWSTFWEPSNIPLSPYSSSKTVHQSDEHIIRQVTKPVKINNHILGYLRVSHPWFEVSVPIRQLLFDLFLATVLMIFALSSTGWLLSGIAIGPVKESYQSLKQFTADASHELRNPLAMIQANVQMALSDPNADPQLLQRQLTVIERLTKRLGILVGDLLFLARLDSGIVANQKQIVPLDALLIEVIEEQRAIAQHKAIFLSLHIGDSTVASDSFNITGDWEQLARLFTNLIGNALKYTNVENTPSFVEVNFQRCNQYLQVEVKDNGIGIAETSVNYIFDRFYRIDPSRAQSVTGGSSGLGLAIAKAIVQEHHGVILVESILGKGSKFTVKLPVE